MEINYEQTGLINRTFLREGVVILNKFFSDDSLKKLKSRIKRLKFSKDLELLHHSYQSVDFSYQSKELTNFLSRIINKKISKLNFKVIKLSWKDYQILNDTFQEKPGVDMVIDITEGWDERWGGLVTYADGLGNYVEVPCTDNSLTLVDRNKGMNRFIQYVNHYAKNKRRIILLARLK